MWNAINWGKRGMHLGLEEGSGFWVILILWFYFILYFILFTILFYFCVWNQQPAQFPNRSSAPKQGQLPLSWPEPPHTEPGWGKKRKGGVAKKRRGVSQGEPLMPFMRSRGKHRICRMRPRSQNLSSGKNSYICFHFFFLLTALLRRNSRTIEFTCFKCAVLWLLANSELCDLGMPFISCTFSQRSLVSLSPEYLSRSL